MIGAPIRHRHSHEALTVIRQPAKLPDLANLHIGIANDGPTVSRKSYGLYITDRLYAYMN